MEYHTVIKKINEEHIFLTAPGLFLVSAFWFSLGNWSSLSVYTVWVDWENHQFGFPEKQTQMGDFHVESLLFSR